MERRKLQHLYWRVGFGLSLAELKKLENKSKKQLVTSLFKGSKSFEPLTIDLSEFALLRNRNYKELKREMGEAKIKELAKRSRNKVRNLNQAWLDRLKNPGSEFREKMTLFWHGHFATIRP